LVSVRRGALFGSLMGFGSRSPSSDAARTAKSIEGDTVLVMWCRESSAGCARDLNFA